MVRVCNSTHLQTCINNNWWSIDTGIRGTKHAIREDNYGPNGFYVGMPSARTVSVTSDDGAHTFDLKFSIIGTALRLWDGTAMVALNRRRLVRQTTAASV